MDELQKDIAFSASKAFGHGLVLWAVWSIDNLGYMDG
jgi:hypothetical protein